MMKIIYLFILYQVSTARKRLLQFPNGWSYGAFGQICLPSQSDFACQTAHQSINDQGTGVVECGVQYSCCLCGYITCGSSAKECVSFKAGADYAAFGVQNIHVVGEANGQGAIIDCNGQQACAYTEMTGSWIDTVRCAADSSCANAIMDFTESKGIECSKSACVGATIILKSNRGGSLICGAETACMNANIQISGIFNVKCNGPQACENAQVVVDNPLEKFVLDCNGDQSCHNLRLTITVPGPVDGCPAVLASNSVVNEPFIWKGVNCGSNTACQGMSLTVVNNGCRPVIIEDLQCSAGNACSGAVFDLHSGSGSAVEIKNCLCGPSCNFATGLDACYNNVRVLDCPDHMSCAFRTESIQNPANDFSLLCTGTEACNQLKLNIVVAGESHNLIQRFSDFVCGSVLSCQRAVINIQNNQISMDGTPALLTINAIQCIADRSCDGAMFIIGDNVHVQQLDCINGACNNCFVKQMGKKVGIFPCDRYTLITQGVPVIPNINGPIVQIPNTPVVVPPAVVPPVVIPPVVVPPAVVIPPIVIPPIVIPPVIAVTSTPAKSTATATTKAAATTRSAPATTKPVIINPVYPNNAPPIYVPI